MSLESDSNPVCVCACVFVCVFMRVRVCLPGCTADLRLPGVRGGLRDGRHLPLRRPARDQEQDLPGHQPELRQDQQCAGPASGGRNPGADGRAVAAHHQAQPRVDQLDGRRGGELLLTYLKVLCVRIMNSFRDLHVGFYMHKSL